MKNVVILHGISGNPNQVWFPYIKHMSEDKGYSVWVPQLPLPDNPSIQVQLPFLMKNGTFNEGTILVAHSSGCALSLALLEKLTVIINQVIFVSGFINPKIVKSIIKNDYSWKTIKKNSREFIFINSDNDPWGANDKEGRKMFAKLGGTLVIRHGEGHMGSESYNQPYKEFPLLFRLMN